MYILAEYKDGWLVEPGLDKCGGAGRDHMAAYYGQILLGTVLAGHQAYRSRLL